MKIKQLLEVLNKEDPELEIKLDVCHEHEDYEDTWAVNDLNESQVTIEYLLDSPCPIIVPQSEATFHKGSKKILVIRVGG